MVSPMDPDQVAPRRGSLPQRRATDSDHDASERRAEEFRRFLVGVALPALEALRSAWRKDGRNAQIVAATSLGRDTEATIIVSHDGRPEFSCTLRACITPERAVVLKRRLVPDPTQRAPAVREEEVPLLGIGGPASDARTLTGRDVMTSIGADYQELRRAQERE